MKRAVLYARVSSEVQRKEGTVKSQVLELKKQIQADGNVLVKKYIDEGYSGAQLDRPAMDELRNDLKEDIFDTLYVLNTDRIAREVTYQIIIIAEILKYKKQVIINSKDYEHNPENKFALTVLGAVAELERAKITERVVRGKALNLSRKLLTGPGHNIYGYDHVRKTHHAPAYFTINEREANTVRTIFNEFISTNISMRLLAEKLKQDGHLMKNGSRNWDRTTVAKILRQPAYKGTMYFNKTQVVTEYANRMLGTAKTSKKFLLRDKSEWVGIPIPPIVSEELFEKTKEHITTVMKVRNRKVRIELLSGLIICGSCGEKYNAYKKNYARPLKRDPNNRYTFIEYMCGRRMQKRPSRCPTKQIVATIIEDKIWKILEGRVAIPNIQQNLETKRTLLLKHIAKIVHYENDTLKIYLNFSKQIIKDKITQDDRHKKRLSLYKL